MKSLERTVALWFALVALISISLGLVTFRSLAATSNHDSWVEHTHVVLRLLERTNSQLGEAESSVRGFVITGDLRVLEPFERDLPRIEAGLRDLERETADNPGQQRRLAELRPLVARKVEVLRQGIRVRQEGGLEAVVARAKDQEGLRLMERIRGLIDLISSEERTLLDLRRRAARSSREWAIACLSLGAAANLAILGLVFRLVERETIRRGRIEGRLAVQHAAMTILAGAGSLGEAIPRLLRAIGEDLGVDVAEFWAVDAPAGVLRLADRWPRSARFETMFAGPSYSWTFPNGRDLPGRIWASGEPAWIDDLARDPDFLRAEIAAKAGLRHGFGFPIANASGVIGVVTLLARGRRPADPALLRVMAALGAQVGQFVERRGRELALLESEARFRTLADGAPIMIWLGDPDGNRTWFSRGWLDFAGQSMGRHLGRGWVEQVHPDDRARFLEVYRAACEGQSEYQIEYRLRRADGEYRWVLGKGLPRKGEPAGSPASSARASTSPNSAGPARSPRPPAGPRASSWPT